MVNDTTKRILYAEPLVDPITTSRKNDLPRLVNLTGLPKLNDDVLQVPAETDTSKKSRLDLLTASDTQKLNK